MFSSPCFDHRGREALGRTPKAFLGASAQEHEHRDVEVLFSCWCWQLAGEESLNRFGQWARMLRTRVTENRNSNECNQAATTPETLVPIK